MRLANYGGLKIEKKQDPVSLIKLTLIMRMVSITFSVIKRSLISFPRNNAASRVKPARTIGLQALKKTAKEVQLSTSKYTQERANQSHRNLQPIYMTLYDFGCHIHLSWMSSRMVEKERCKLTSNSCFSFVNRQLDLLHGQMRVSEGEQT